MRLFIMYLLSNYTVKQSINDFLYFFAIFVHGNAQHGVVGLQGALNTCFTCKHQVHTFQLVTNIIESDERMEHETPDFLVEFFAESNCRDSTLVSANTSRKEWKSRPVSWRTQKTV